MAHLGKGIPCSKCKVSINPFTLTKIKRDNIIRHKELVFCEACERNGYNPKTVANSKFTTDTLKCTRCYLEGGESSVPKAECGAGRRPG